MSELPEYVQNFLLTIAEEEGLTNYKLHVQPGSKHGDGFLGIMTSVQITGDQWANGKSATKTLHLLCKTPPTNIKRRKQFMTDVVFAREIQMYSKVLPEFTKFQSAKGLTAADSFCAYPKCYVAHADEEKKEYVLIMEDLRPRHFQMWPKENPIALDHVQLVVKEMGKLHGIAFALKDQKPEIYNELKSLNDLLSELLKSEGLTGFMADTLNRALNVLEKPEYIKLVTEVRENYISLFEECFGEDACEPFGVLGHGDPWNNNFLFQYDENGNKVQGMCFVDWQISRYCSPAFDLLYNLFSGTDKPLRDKHFMDLLRLYHSSLSDIIRRLGSDPEKLFTFDDLMGQLRKFGRFSLAMAPMIIQFLVASADDIQDVDEFSEKMDSDKSIDLLKEYPEDVKKRYSFAVNNAIGDLIKYGFVKIE